MVDLRNYIEKIEQEIAIQKENIKHEQNKLHVCEDTMAKKIANFTNEIKERGNEITSKDAEIAEWKRRYTECEKYSKGLEKRGGLFSNRTFTFIYDAAIFTAIVWAGSQVNE